ncbi:MAG: hypothetical protein ACOYOB_19415, partial [Myxococcota bacterium]
RSDFGRQVDLDVSTREKEFVAGLVPVSVLLDVSQWPAWRMGYQKYFGWNEGAKMDLITLFEQEVQQRFVYFKVPVIELLRDTPKEAVCQVFEKVNTGGVALTVFELVTATFAGDNFRLREDWEARQARIEAYAVLKGFGETEFLQGITLLASYRRHAADIKAAVSCKRKDILKLELEDYTACAGDYEKGLYQAARLLHRLHVFRADDVPYRTQLIPLAAVCAQIGTAFDQQTVRDKLAQWFWCGVFGELYGGTTETRFALDMEHLCDWILKDGGDPRSVTDASFQPQRLLSLQTRNSAAYKGMMALMVKKGSRDFISGDEIALVTGFQLDVDIHHIFPRAWCEKMGNLPRTQWNSIVNKAPLTARSNQKLGGDAPSKYLARIVNGGSITTDKLEDVLESHFIDPEPLRADDFGGFLRQRAVALLDAVEQAMGKPVLGRDADATVGAVGGPLVHEPASMATL